MSQILRTWDEIAAVLNVHRDTVRNIYAKKHGLPVRKGPAPQCRVEITRDELEAWRVEYAKRVVVSTA